MRTTGKMRVLAGMVAMVCMTVCMTVNADVIWSDNFDAANTNGWVTGAVPVFKTGVSTGQWARGANSVALIDQGGGDNAVKWAPSNDSRGFAIWLSVTNLNLTAGNTYSLTFDIANYVGTASANGDGLAQVIKAKGVDAGGTVAMDLVRTVNFIDLWTSAGGATMGRAMESTTATSFRVDQGGALNFGSNGSYTLDFLVNSGDEYIGLVFASQDRTATGASPIQVTFELDNVSVIPEPATVGMLGLGALITLLVRRLSTR